MGRKGRLVQQIPGSCGSALLGSVLQLQPSLESRAVSCGCCSGPPALWPQTLPSCPFQFPPLTACVTLWCPAICARNFSSLPVPTPPKALKPVESSVENW